MSERTGQGIFAALLLITLRGYAQAESFIRTLKYEEVYRTEYRDLEEAKALIGKFLEKIYNQQRLHSALGYRPPLEFERSLRPLPAAGKGRA